MAKVKAKCSICGGSFDEKWLIDLETLQKEQKCVEKNPGVKCRTCTLDEHLILINAYFEDRIIYPKGSVLANILKNLVKEGYLIKIGENKTYIIYRGTKKGKEKGKSFTDMVQKKYLKKGETVAQEKNLA